MSNRVYSVIRAYWPRLLILVVFIIFIISLYFLDVHNLATLENLQRYHLRIKTFIQSYYWQSVALFITAYILDSVFALPLAAPLSLAAGFFYTFVPGTVYVMVGALVGGTISFIVTRFLLGHIVQQVYHDRLVRFNREIDRYGAYYLLFVRLVPIFPFFLINMFASLTSLRLITFILVSIVGMLPMTALYVYIGTQLHALHTPEAIWSWQLIVAITLLGICLGGAIVAKRLWEAR